MLSALLKLGFESVIISPQTLPLLLWLLRVSLLFWVVWGVTEWASLFLLTCLDRRPFCFSRYVSSYLLSFFFFFFFLHFTVSLCVHCDMVVLACSPEHKILSLQTAGLWYSTWCLTASCTVSAFDDSAFVPATGFWYFTTHTDCDCVPLSRTPPQENCQMWSFVRWDLQTPTITKIVYMLVVALYIFNVWKSHHHHPSVCSLCSSFSFKLSSSSHLSVCERLRVKQRAQPPVWLLHHQREKGAGQEKGSFSPPWHQRSQAAQAGNKHGAFN